jgi:hypothetical protein
MVEDSISWTVLVEKIWFQLKSDILKKRNYEKTIKYLSIMFLGLGLLATSSCETTNLDLTDN